MPDTTSAPRGLDGIVAVQTRLSHVDGQNGVLIIGGHDLKELAHSVTFEEAAHLLWTGHLPSASEADALSREIADLRSIRRVEVIESADTRYLYFTRLFKEAGDLAPQHQRRQPHAPVRHGRRPR